MWAAHSLTSRQNWVFNNPEQDAAQDSTVRNNCQLSASLDVLWHCLCRAGDTSLWPSAKGAGILESVCSEQSSSWTGLSSRGLVSFSPPRGGGPEGERTPASVARPFVSLRAWLSKNGLLMKALFHFTGDRERIRCLRRTGSYPSHVDQC